VSVALDIKPQSWPNPLNVKGKGVFPVAILGIEDFDVSSIDTASIQLAGVSAVRSSVEIVAELVDAPGDLADGEVLALALTGRLLDETPIEGTDCVVLTGSVPRSLAAMKSDITRDGIVNIRDFAVLCEYWLESAAIEY
jgi:hypothetical protein